MRHSQSKLFLESLRSIAAPHRVAWDTRNPRGATIPVLIALSGGRDVFYLCPRSQPNGVLLVGDALCSPALRYYARAAGKKKPRIEGLWPAEVHAIGELLRSFRKEKKVTYEELRVYLSSGPDRNRFPLLDRTNPLSEVLSSREVSFSGAPPRRNLSNDDQGRFCPLDTPDDDPGARVSLVPGTRVGGTEIRKSNRGFLGHAALLIPFIQHTKPLRAAIAAKELKQALPLLFPEQPLVRTGHEGEVARLSGRVLRASVDGTVRISPANVLYLRGRGRTMSKHLIAQPQHVNGIFGGSCYWDSARVEDKGKVKKGELLAEGCGVKDGMLALGVNLCCAYMTWDGYNFEDAIVISDRLVSENLLTSRHVYEERMPASAKASVEALLGNEIRFGDYLGTSMFSRFIHGKIVKVFTTDDSTRVWISEDRPVEVGDKIAGRHGNKGMVARIVPHKEMPYFYRRDTKGKEIGPRRYVDIILNPTGVVSRINLGQVLETHYGWSIHELKTRSHLATLKRSKLPTLERSGEPWRDPNLQELRDLLVKTGLDAYGRATLYRDRNGRREVLGKHVVGYQYFLKLGHLSRDEVWVLKGEPGFDPITDEPKEGRQLGEMGVRALRAHDAPAIIRELLVAESDDVRAREELTLDGPLRTYFPGTLRAALHYLRGLGLGLRYRSTRGEKSVTLDELESETFEAHKIHALRIQAPNKEDFREWRSGRHISFQEPIHHPLFGLTLLHPGRKVPSGNAGKYRAVLETLEPVKRKKLVLARSGTTLPDLPEGQQWMRVPSDPSRRGVKLPCLPRIPKAYHPRSPSQPKSDLEELYARVVNQSDKNEQALWAALGRLMITGWSVPWRPNRYRSILDHLTGKEGLIAHLLAKESLYGGTAIIVPDPALRINELSLPLDLILQILGPLKAGLGLPANWWTVVAVDDQMKRRVVARQLEDWLKEKKILVLGARYPIHHKYNILAFRARVSTTYCIGFPPLLCKGMHADFDGDHLSVFLVLSREARKEAWRLLPTAHLLSSAVRGTMLHWEQDFALGAGAPTVGKMEDLSSNDPSRAEVEIALRQRNALAKATRSGVTVSIFEVQDLAKGEKTANEERSWANLKRLASSGNSIAKILVRKARGKLSHLREMADQVGMLRWTVDDKTIEFQVQRNFLQGLTPEEYWNYASFARYLTVEHATASRQVHTNVRYLTEAAYDVDLRRKRCQTSRSISLPVEYVWGRVPFERLPGLDHHSPLDDAAIEILKVQGKKTVRVRSPLYCELKGGVCEACYGLDPSRKDWLRDGYPIGVLAAQSVGERITQEVLKILHRSPEQGDSPLLHEEFAACMRMPFREEVLYRLLDIFGARSATVDPRHFEVLLRVARYDGKKWDFEAPSKDLSRGWLSALPVYSSRNSVLAALRMAARGKMIDHLTAAKSRILVGLGDRPQGPNGIFFDDPLFEIRQWRNKFKVMQIHPPTRGKGKRERRALFKQLVRLAGLFEEHYAAGGFDLRRIPRSALRFTNSVKDKILSAHVLLPDHRRKAVRDFVKAERDDNRQLTRGQMKELERRVNWSRGKRYASILEEYAAIFGRPLPRRDLPGFHKRLVYWHKLRTAGKSPSQG